MRGKIVPKPKITARYVVKVVAIHVASKVKQRLTKLIWPPRFGPGTWQYREEHRFSDGTYTKLPWHLKPIEGHYAHLSNKKQGLVAYTANERDGERDVQVVSKPGKYLEKFYGIKNQGRIRRLAGMVAAQGWGVRFTSDADEILRIFERGPPSCMSGLESKAYHGWHGARAYANCDLQIAYMLDKDGTIIARSIVWPKKKIYTRAYGNRLLIEGALQNLGYRMGGRGCLSGAKISMVPNSINNQTVHFSWPYMDTGPYWHKPISGTHTKLRRLGGRTGGYAPVHFFTDKELAAIKKKIAERYAGTDLRNLRQYYDPVTGRVLVKAGSNI